MIIDAFPFFNEIALLQVRLNYLGPAVDQFVIIESTIDFAGKRKELMLTKDFIQHLPYARKIRVLHWKPRFFLLIVFLSYLPPSNTEGGYGKSNTFSGITC